MYERFLTDLGLRDEDYQVQIMALISGFQYDISAYVLAEVIGCSIGYARRFEYTDEQGASEKLWSQNQRGSQIGPALRKRVLRRDGSECVRCGAEEGLITHHIIPAGQGGPAKLDNLAMLCDTCHRAAHGGRINSGDTCYDSIESFWAWVSA
jgi:hypothetical protein